MKIRAALFLLLLTTSALAGCQAAAAPSGQAVGNTPATSSDWRIGFWAWEPSWNVRYAVPREKLSVDDVYVQMRFDPSPNSSRVPAEWPVALPPARRYWAVWRVEGNERPFIHPDAPESLGVQFRSLQRDAARRSNEAAGLQIDFDCPTARLPEYAAWLSVLRKHLPSGTRLSITALLDWFRPDTGVADVLRQVDEFVPQFYDVRPPASDGMTIAEPIDAPRWGPVFNRFKVPYRIGIGSFGRLLDRGRHAFELNLALFDVLSNQAFVASPVTKTAAGERRLLLRASRTTSVGWTPFKAGETLEAVLPTRESVASAYAEARKMGGFCAGVIFYRWPQEGESSVMAPEGVLRAIAGRPPAEDALDIVAGDCSAVRCSDLYLALGDQYPIAERTVELRASTPLEYFLPSPKVGALAAMTARDTIAVRLPANHGEARLYLGRAMSKGIPAFAIVGGAK